jgi:integrase
MSVKLRRKKVDGGGASLYLDIYYNGKRHYEFLKLYLTKDRDTNRETLRLAESIAAKRQLEMQNSEHGFIPQFKRKASFIEYFEKLTNERDRDKSNWKSVLKILKEFTKGEMPFSGITDQWLEEYKRFLLCKVKPNTAVTYFTITKGALNHAVREKILPSNPAAHVKRMKGQDVEKSFLLIDEVKMLATAPCSNPAVKRAFLFSCYTGLRLSDVRALTWGKVKGLYLDFRQVKTRGMEHLPLNEQARMLLDAGHDPKILPLDSTLVFDLPSNSTISASIREWSKTAAIEKKVTYHTSRHTFATLLLTNGADIYTVSKLLGHKNIETTLVYAKIVDQKKNEAMAMLPLIEVSG